MTDNNGKNEKSGIQVISRAASILRVLRESKSGMSLGQIASKVDLPRSTVQRITSALADENFVVTDASGKGLRLGPELSSMSDGAEFNIIEHCRLLLTELTQKTGETTDLAALRGIGMVFLDQVPGTNRLTTVSQVGEVFPLSSTANGKACLSMLPEEDARKLVQNEWDRTGRPQDETQFYAELARIRETGLAYDMDQHAAGVSAIGIGFQAWNNELHAISVPVPSFRFADKRRSIEEALLQTASNIQRIFK